MQEDRTVDYYMQRFFKRYELNEFASQMQVEKVYRALAGDLISRLTTSISFSKGTLRLRLLSAALRQELTMRREGLRVRMNQELGGEIVKKIMIV
ncbi:MAG: DUF721 domain-containing protein [Bacteroidales bacterium]|nr:DUF721 domain-containing protein [Bacteroidales bacterium]